MVKFPSLSVCQSFFSFFSTCLIPLSLVLRPSQTDRLEFMSSITLLVWSSFVSFHLFSWKRETPLFLTSSPSIYQFVLLVMNRKTGPGITNLYFCEVDSFCENISRFRWEKRKKIHSSHCQWWWLHLIFHSSLKSMIHFHDFLLLLSVSSFQVAREVPSFFSRIAMKLAPHLIKIL